MGKPSGPCCTVRPSVASLAGDFAGRHMYSQIMLQNHKKSRFAIIRNQTTSLISVSSSNVGILVSLHSLDAPDSFAMASFGLRAQPLNTVNHVNTANRLPHVSGRRHPILRHRVTEEALPICRATSYQVRSGASQHVVHLALLRYSVAGWILTVKFPDLCSRLLQHQQLRSWTCWRSTPMSSQTL